MRYLYLPDISTFLVTALRHCVLVLSSPLCIPHSLQYAQFLGPILQHVHGQKSVRLGLHLMRVSKQGFFPNFYFSQISTTHRNSVSFYISKAALCVPEHSVIVFRETHTMLCFGFVTNTGPKPWGMSLKLFKVSPKIQSYQCKEQQQKFIPQDKTYNKLLHSQYAQIFTNSILLNT